MRKGSAKEYFVHTMAKVSEKTGVQIKVNADTCQSHAATRHARFGGQACLHCIQAAALKHQLTAPIFNAMWQDSAAYGTSSSKNNYYGRGNQPDVPLQFYDQSSFYPGSRSSLEGNVVAQGSIAQSGTSGFTGSIQPAGRWWTAFGTGGFEGEPPLLEGTYGHHDSCAFVLPCLHVPPPPPQNLESTSLT